jgi:hypothetical protein
MRVTRRDILPNIAQTAHAVKGFAWPVSSTLAR